MNMTKDRTPEVGDKCVFEITKGDKKWTIFLDDFFDKVIQIWGEK